MESNRRNFLKATGLIGAASLFPISKAFSENAEGTNRSTAASCTLIPTETAGPFPLDLTENNTFLRQNLTEDKTGVPLKVRLKIIGDSNCLPMQNVRVNIWHCDKDGLYSGYDETNNPGQAGKTFLRGYQFTDVNGEVEFTTIFPGWYNGRICHIHFQVYVSSSYAAISQLTFDVDTKNAIYTANSSLYTKGADPMSLSSDNIFSDGYQYQIANLTENSGIGGYDAYLEVTVKGDGTTGLGNREKLNAANFTLGQNYPNPFLNTTSIPVELRYPSDLKLELFDLEGKKVFQKDMPGLNAGEHQIPLNLNELGLAQSSYIFQLSVKNQNGTYVDSKMMSTAR